MATFGQGINPQLGAIDYSAFSRGAAQQAQGVMQGGQGIANGIAQLGQQIGGAIQEYNQKQEVKKKEEMAVNAFISFANQNPREAQALGLQKDQKTGSWDKKAVGHVVKSLGGAGAALGVASQLTQAKQAQAMEEQKMQLAQQQARDERIRLSIAQMQAVADANRPQGKIVNPASFRSAGPNGMPIEITIDQNTGREIARGPVNGVPKYVRTPEEEALAAGMSAESKADAEASVKFLEGVSESAAQADNALTKYVEIEDLLSRDTTRAGFGQDWLTTIKAVGSRLGASEKDLADQQKLEALLAEDGLLETRNLLKGQGQVSNAERDRIDKVALNAKKDKNALRELLDLRKAAAQRALAAQEVRIELESQNLGAREIKKRLNSWYRDNPFSAFVPAGGGYDFKAANSIINR